MLKKGFFLLGLAVCVTISHAAPKQNFLSKERCIAALKAVEPILMNGIHGKKRVKEMNAYLEANHDDSLSCTFFCRANKCFATFSPSFSKEGKRKNFQVLVNFVK